MNILITNVPKGHRYMNLLFIQFLFNNSMFNEIMSGQEKCTETPPSQQENDQEKSTEVSSEEIY